MTTNMHETSISLKQHLRIEQLILLCCFINMRALLSKQLLLVHISPKILYKLWFNLLILDVKRVTYVVELPPFLHLKILRQILPVIVNTLC